MQQDRIKPSWLFLDRKNEGKKSIHSTPNPQPYETKHKI